MHSRIARYLTTFVSFLELAGTSSVAPIVPYTYLSHIMAIFFKLHASDLIEAIRTMNSLNQYKQMVFYIEACESGSMFANGLLPEDWNGESRFNFLLKLFRNFLLQNFDITWNRL